MSQALKRILSDVTKIEGVKGVIVVSHDGLVLDALVPSRDINVEDFAASFSQLVDLAEKLGAHFELGNADIMTLEFNNGRIVVEDIGENFILVVADRSALIGMIRNEIKKLKDRIKAIIG